MKITPNHSNINTQLKETSNLLDENFLPSLSLKIALAIVFFCLLLHFWMSQQIPCPCCSFHSLSLNTCLNFPTRGDTSFTYSHLRMLSNYHSGSLSSLQRVRGDVKLHWKWFTIPNTNIETQYSFIACSLQSHFLYRTLSLSFSCLYTHSVTTLSWDNL